MFVKDEYDDLIKEFTKDVKTQLSDETKCLLLIGSVVTNDHLPGESDCDFLLVLNKSATIGEKLEETLGKIGDIINKYFEEPVYASLIDVEILEEDFIPSNGNNAYPGTKIIRAQQGKALIGENPFLDINVSDEQLKEGGKIMARESYEHMKDIMVFPPEDAYQAIYLIVEAVLGCACGYLYYQGEREFYKSTAYMQLEEKYKDKIDMEPVLTSHRLRLASKNVDTTNFVQDSLAFCREVMKQIFT